MSTHRVCSFAALGVAIVAILIAATSILISSRSEDAGADVLFNSGLEIIDSSGSNPSGWWRAGYGTNTASWWLTTAAHGGKVVQGLRITKCSSGDRKLLTNWTGAGLSVIPGRTYKLSA